MIEENAVSFYARGDILFLFWFWVGEGTNNLCRFDDREVGREAEYARAYVFGNRNLFWIVAIDFNRIWARIEQWRVPAANEVPLGREHIVGFVGFFGRIEENREGEERFVQFGDIFEMFGA